MAPIQPAPYDEEPERAPGRGRKAVRYAVPVAVAGVAAATISLVPALADSGDPSLPSITAQQLLTRIAASQTQTVDGTVKVTTDLGLPSALSGGAGGAMFGGGAAGSGAAPGSGSGSAGDSPAAPQTRLPALLTGTHTLHVAADGQERQKISLLEPAAEYSVIHDGAQLWAYDSASNQAYHRTLPQPAPGSGTQQGGPSAGSLAQGVPATPAEAAQQVIKATQGTASITVDGTSRVAGHSAYDLLITPQHADTTTVGAIRVAVDSRTGVPLKFTLTPKGGGKAVFDIGFTRVGFGKPAASTFHFTLPKGVKVTEAPAAKPSSIHADSAKPAVLGTGWDSIAVITSPGGLADKTGKAGAPGPFGSGASGAKGDDSAQSLMNGFGKKVSGGFGTGTLFHTRLVNALLTDKGTLYVGAVTQSALTDAASAAK